MTDHTQAVAVRVGGTLLLAGVALISAVKLGAQAPAAPARTAAAPSSPAKPAPTPKASALRDFTGYWVSEVTEEWRYRMVVPDKGDVLTNVPLNTTGRTIAEAWDPEKDKASGNQCKGYGAAGIMYIPGRLHIYWQDDNTMRIDTDSGTQTRLFHFGAAPQPKAADWQGYSVARWGDDEPIARRILGGGPLGQGGPEYEADIAGGFGGNQTAQAEAFKPPVRNYLHVTTTHMRPGYLHKNGVPYSANATLDEYFTNYTYNGTDWLFLTGVVTDLDYLMEPYIFHTHYKKLADNTGWDPTPCRVDEAR
jgi:hypothetical protein